MNLTFSDYPEALASNTIIMMSKHQLHAHPNIEVVFVVDGCMHEYRFTEPIPKDFSDRSLDPPNISTPPVNHSQPVFEHRMTRSSLPDLTGMASSFIINDSGSIHVTFTREEVRHV